MERKNVVIFHGPFIEKLRPHYFFFVYKFRPHILKWTMLQILGVYIIWANFRSKTWKTELRCQLKKVLSPRKALSEITKDFCKTVYGKLILTKILSCV